MSDKKLPSDQKLPPEVVKLLAGVLAEPAFDKWANTKIERLSDRTPYEAIADGDLVAVLKLVRGYQDSSFT